MNVIFRTNYWNGSNEIRRHSIMTYTHILIRCTHTMEIIFYGLHATRRKRRREQNVCDLQKWFYLHNRVKFQFTYYRTHVIRSCCGIWLEESWVTNLRILFVTAHCEVPYHSTNAVVVRTLGHSNYLFLALNTPSLIIMVKF